MILAAGTTAANYVFMGFGHISQGPASETKLSQIGADQNLIKDLKNTKIILQTYSMALCMHPVEFIHLYYMTFLRRMQFSVVVFGIETFL